MIQVLRYSGLAVVVSVLLALAVVAGFLAVSFVVTEWRPDWTIAESLSRWMHGEPEPSAASLPGSPNLPWDGLWPWLAAAPVPIAWYLVVWWGWGRDRLLGIAFPRFRPPEGLSPSTVRQILGMGFDDKVLAAEILNLAVCGYLRIERDRGGRYSLRRTDGPSGQLSAAQRRLLAALFRARPWLRLHVDDAAHLRVAVEAFRSELEHELEGPVYSTNLWAVALGIAISGAALVMATASLPHAVPTNPEILLAVAVVIAMVAVNVLFFRLMKAPTELGREVLDGIGGFRRFLATAEHERMKLADGPKLTSHLYARHLPYALAMDIELDWSEQFADTLRRTVPDALDFDWYADPMKTRYDAGLVGMVRALGGAVAMALGAPGDGDEMARVSCAAGPAAPYPPHDARP